MVRLNAAGGYDPDAIRRLLAVTTPQEAVNMSPADMAALMGISQARAQRLSQRAMAFDAVAELKAVETLEAALVAWDDADYPRLLLHTPQAPLLLYVRGDLTFEPTAVACVGSRGPTMYGRRMARRIAFDLAAAGHVVVSGLARGIDGEAHKAAIDAGGRTWAVLGSGLERLYPPEHEPLARQILDCGGCLISELPLKASPVADQFPRRNRIVAGLCWATVVVEGRVQSGSLITGRLALDLGRETFAVPGPADSPLSQAPHSLLKAGGASPVCSAQDVLDHLPREYSLRAKRPDPQATRAPSGNTLAHEQEKILELIGPDSRTVDDLVHQTGIGISRLSHLLFEMELQGLVLPVSGKRYAKKGS